MLHIYKPLLASYKYTSEATDGYITW